MLIIRSHPCMDWQFVIIALLLLLLFLLLLEIFSLSPLFLSLLSYSLKDLDECNGDNNKCHAESICTNTFGSYSCECSAGYTGDGRNCIGMKRIPRL